MRKPPALLVLLLVSAGCLGSQDPQGDAYGDLLDPSLRAHLTEPVYDVLGHFDHTFTGTTDTQLYVDFYRPALPDGEQSPVILVFTPYQEAQPGEAVPGLADAPYWSEVVDFFVPRGYTVAFADVRGNHRAGGCIDQTGPKQWQDGYDYVEWLAAQPWSNGKVGMYGVSYDAETQFTTAMMQPPHLVTIVPVASVSNQYEWNFYQGVPYEGQPNEGMVGYLEGSLYPSLQPADAPHYPEKLACQGEALGAGVDFSGDYTQFWRDRDYRPMAQRVQASVLHVHGLADWNVRPIHIDPLFNDLPGEKRGIFGLWPHALPDREDWETILHAWFDYWLLDRQNGILDILPPVLVEDSTGQWHGMDAFPPRHPEWWELELGADGAITTPGQAKVGVLALHDQTTEVNRRNQASGALADASTTLTGYPTRLEFTWKVPEDLHVVGRPTLSFTATSSEESTHWAVEMIVDEDPRCQYEFSNRTLNQTICHNAGYQDTRHRDGLDNPKPLTPGEPYRLDVTMFPQYDVLRAGQTLRIVISNNNADIQQDPTNSHNEVQFGGEQPALLRLPLVRSTTLLPEDSLPAIYPGYLATDV